MMNMCERCRRRTELYYARCCDEYLCEDCEAVAVAPNELNGEEDPDRDAVGAAMGRNE